MAVMTVNGCYAMKFDQTVDTVTADDNEDTHNKDKKRNGQKKTLETQSKMCHINKNGNMVPRRETGSP
jgi:hypothetical protein